MRDIGNVEYYRCENCGFVLSKTHAELDTNRWEQLNSNFHKFFESNKTGINQPPYIDQANMISVLSKNNIIDSQNILDYASGYGTLNKILLKYYNINSVLYDKYIKSDNLDYINFLELNKNKYNTVINSAMFEHILTRKDLDDVNILVSNQGCLIIHTVVCENIPCNENWFYLTPPVHTAFHTNKSMNILMNQWNYESSLYCPSSKCWVLFKKAHPNLEEKIKVINSEFQTNYLYYKIGFSDYWKN
jgi:hypothetical protein